ncbi:MAG: leucine-rich repeat protein [Bacteroidales bacterium]|nr:leucine-rich repeat protein [Bacteroidales bacterium]
MVFINTVDTVSDNDIANSLINRTITELSDNIIETVRKNAFHNCTDLTKVNFPNVSSIEYQSFQNCSSLQVADFSRLNSIGQTSLNGCNSLEALIIRNYDEIPKINVGFGDCGLGSIGYVYVPSALVNSYKSSEIWSNYSDYIRAIEDYPEVCSNLGKLYETLYNDTANYNVYSPYGIVYNNDNNIFIAYGEGILYSTDGKTWTKSNYNNSSSYNKCSCIKYNNGIWVISEVCHYSSYNRALYYSEDCKTWTKSNVNEKADIYSIECNDNIWVAGGQNGLYYSEDGKTWTKVDDDTIQYIEKIIYGNGIFVAICYNSRGLYYSEDGKTWTKQTNVSNNTNDIIYCNGAFIVVTDDYSSNNSINNIFISTDCKTWHSVGISKESIRRIFYINNKLFVQGSSGYVYSSEKLYNYDDLITLDITTFSKSKYKCSTLYDIIYANHIYIAKSPSESSYEIYGLMYSYDGLEWYKSNITYVREYTGSYTCLNANSLYYDENNGVLYAAVDLKLHTSTLN